MKASLEKVLSMLQLMERYTEIYEAERRLQRRKRMRIRHRALVQEVPKRSYRTVQKPVGPVAPRYDFEAKIIMHKNGRYLKARTLNISRSGLFVSAGLGIFRPNELIRIQIRPTGHSQTYSALARVARFTDDPRYPSGYGLQFVT